MTPDVGISLLSMISITPKIEKLCDLLLNLNCSKSEWSPEKTNRNSI